MLVAAGPSDRRPHRRAARAGRHRRRRPATSEAGDIAAGPAHHGRRLAGRPTPTSTWWSSSSAASSRPGPWSERPSRRASRWSPPTRRCSPLHGVELCGRRRAPTASTCSTRRRWPGRSRWSGSLRESLTGERILRVMGIVNGTTNFILTRMGEEGADYADALAEAQALGLRRARPDRRRGGLRRRGQGGHPRRRGLRVRRGVDDVYREGITGHRRGRHRRSPSSSATSSSCWPSSSASRRRRRSRSGSTRPWSRRPTRWRRCRDAFNAVFIEGEPSGELMLYGQGAGGLPDGQRRARRPDRRRPQPPRRHHRAVAPDRAGRGPCPIDDLASPYYLSLDVVDRPGVLAAVAGGLRRPRRVDPVDGAGGLRRRGPAASFLTHPARGGGRAGHPRRAGPARRGRPQSAAMLRIVGSGTSRRRRSRTGLGAGWRGVIEEYRDFLPVGRRHAGRHPARGRHPAAPGAPALGAGRRPGCCSRSRGPIPPARSRTGA